MKQAEAFRKRQKSQNYHQNVYALPDLAHLKDIVIVKHTHSKSVNFFVLLFDSVDLSKDRCKYNLTHINGDKVAVD